jgi:uncharacterized protein
MSESTKESGRRFTLSVLPELLAIARLDAGATIPAWATSGPFFSVTRTADELSIVCEQARVPEGVKAQRGWRALKVHGRFDLSEVGVMAALSAALASEGVSVLAIATFDTDYLLVSGQQLKRAIEALRSAGHLVE